MSSKIWFITGTSSGFGRSLVQTLLARNDRVIATARNLNDIRDFHDLADESRLRTMQLDITDSHNIQSKIEEAIEIWGHVDVLVNNAGDGHKTMLEEGGTSALMKSFNVHVFGTMNVTYALLPHMRKRKSGTVVIVGSKCAFNNEYDGIGAYAAAKAATQSLGETLSAELRRFNIRVLITQPGMFRTKMLGNVSLHVENRIPDYDEIREQMSDGFQSMGGLEPNDPVKGMELLADVVKGEGKFEGRKLPLWLVLGTDAVQDFRARTNRALKTLDENLDISEATEFDPLRGS